MHYFLNDNVFEEINMNYWFYRYLKLPNGKESTFKCLEKFGESVEILDLSGLKIRKLPSFTFKKLPKLKWLDLRY